MDLHRLAHWILTAVPVLSLLGLPVSFALYRANKAERAVAAADREQAQHLMLTPRLRVELIQTHIEAAERVVSHVSARSS